MEASLSTLRNLEIQLRMDFIDMVESLAGEMAAGVPQIVFHCLWGIT